MADTINTSSDVVLVGQFQDGDDRTISYPNPAVDVEDAAAMSQTAESINALGNFFSDNKLIIGDKTGAPFLYFKAAKVSNKTTTHFDLT